MDETSFITQKVASQRDVIQFYDNYAASWDKRFGELASTQHFLNRRWNSFLSLLPKNTQSLRALELGVGTGVYIERASPLFAHITAIDGAANMLKELEAKVKAKNITNVTTLQDDATTLANVPDASADVVYFFGLVEHIIDVESFFKTLYRVTKPGGVVMGVIVNNKSPWYSIRRLIRGTGLHCESDRYFSTTDIRRWAKDYGFASHDYRYWGFVPAGIKGAVYALLKIAEPIMEKTPLRFCCGSLTFKLTKA